MMLEPSSCQFSHFLVVSESLITKVEIYIVSFIIFTKDNML